ncbi:phosphoglucomutase/phosphomannomutase, alpha/beta/alpha domain II [Dictyocaulus viviparus]|uniref:phosphoglucomutase (alpha-D-glucose-1,6-bisphosphate-dependent) n=1 Tax=Dictyocaulus viviparus TaxID=29172 RepID=A0A0D8Y340_DICVI|nr:phosphoglucomutase/phosphomannomutase, alpha/beta/alpha domain II [Dictyocaulus viviparus]
MLNVQMVPTKPFQGQKPGTSGLRKRVSEFQQEHYTENFVQAVLDGGLGSRKKGSVLVVGGDGRFLCLESVNVIIKIAAANGVSRLIVGQNGFLSTPAVSNLIRKGFEGVKVDGGIILTASHNPGGPKGDFGIKFNCENGGPAPDGLEACYTKSNVNTTSNYVEDANTKLIFLSPEIDDFRYDFDVGGVGHFTVNIIDSVKDYVELMQSIFDFGKIKSLISGQLTGKRFEVLVDSMHGATGPYVSTILCDFLGVDSHGLLRTVPKPDFGGGHPDPNLTYAKQLVEQLGKGKHDFGAAFDGDGDRNMILGKGFFVTPSDSLAVIAENLNCIPYFTTRKISGFARSMPTAGAIDLVAKSKGLEVFETPTGWKYFGNLMDAGRICLCGEESFGTGSDHIREKDGVWAMLAWLQIIAEKKKSVEDIVKEQWELYGRNVFTRYDYENVEASGANLLMTFLESQMVTFVKFADNFVYKDPIDGSTASKQGLRIVFEDGSRLVYRLSGTGSAGATIRLYVDSYVPPSDKDKLFAPAQVNSTRVYYFSSIC